MLFIIARTNLFGQPAADFDIIYISQCPPGIIKLVNNSSNASAFEWNFGNGNSAQSSLDTLSQVYPNAGQYTITLKALDGSLENELSKTINIYKNPKANFTTNMASGCIPMTINFTAVPILGDAAIVSYNWDFRNGTVNQTSNPTIEYKSVGEYGVLLRVTDANGCFDFIDKENCLKTYPQPTANFTYSPLIACNVPAEFSFTNHTSHTLKLNYQWTLGNDTVSSLENPKTIYTAKGTYEVHLLASNKFGCSSEAQKSIRINESILSQFDMTNANGNVLNNGDTICSGIKVRLQNTTIPSNVSFFTLNGVSLGSDSIINTTLSKAGWNIIQLRPKPGVGCADIAEKRLFVKLIKADFDISDIYCDFPLTVNFTNKSLGAESYSWELAQENNSNIENPEIILNNIYIAGDYIDSWPIYSYKNKLIVRNKFGCLDSVTKHIEFVHPEAKLQADKVHGCVPLEINFFDKSDNKSQLVSKLWKFGDGVDSILGADSILHAYTLAGDYNARLIVENDKHCKDTSELLEINVGDKLDPIFEVSPSSICYNDSVTFINKTANSELIDYWSYSSSANVFSQCEKIPSPKLPVHANTTGYHSVKLDVDYNGCVSSKTLHKALYIRGPIAGFTQSGDCSTPTKISFTGDTSLVSSFLWDFGDGNTDAGNINQNHTYAASGDYTVKLTSLNDTTLCSHEFEQIVKIRQIKANLNVDTIACVGDLVLYNATNSIDYLDDCFDEGFQWQLGTDASPRKTYKSITNNTFSKRGVNEIKLKVFDANGCSDSISQDVYVYQPEASFTVDTNTGCTPFIIVNFFNTSNDSSISNVIWNFGDFITSTENDTVRHTYHSSNDEIFNPVLTTFDTNGCRNNYLGKSISIFKPDAGFNTDNRNVCLGTSLVFNQNYIGADSSYWQFDTAMFIQQENKHAFNKTGIFSISHKVFVGVCSDSLTLNDYISVEEAVADIIASDTITECYPQTIVLNHSNTGSKVIYGEWDFDFKGHKLLEYSDTVAFSYSYPREFFPNLKVVTKNGCTATDTIKITVNGPYAEFSISDKHPCKLQEINFKMDIEKDVDKQLWDFGDGLASIEKSPSYKYKFIDTIVSSLTISDANGCTPPAIYDTVLIKQVKSEFSFPDNDTIFCVTETLLPTNTSIGGISYKWMIDDAEYSDLFEPRDISFNLPKQYLISLKTIDDANCSDSSFQVVRVFQLPNVKAIASDSICRGLEHVNLKAQTDLGCSVYWEPNDFIENATAFSTTAEIFETTQFILIAQDTNSCTNSDSALTYVHQYPEIKRVPEADTTILVGEKVKLQIVTSNSSTIVWENEVFSYSRISDTFEVMPFVTTAYFVSVEDVCFTTEQEFVVNVRELYTIELPEVFTPNGDGINDKIYVRGGGIKELIEFKVYNRFGNIVYNSNVLDEGWDGYYNGKLQNADVYNYFVKVLNYMNEEEEKTGSFNIVH